MKALLLSLAAITTLAFSSSAQLIINNDCSNAWPMACGNTYTGSTVGAAVSNEAGNCGGTHPGVWYSFTGTGTEVTVTACQSGTWMACLAIFSGECSSLWCDGGPIEVFNCNSTTPATYTFTAALGVQYYFYMFSFDNTTGSFDITLDCAGPPSLDAGITTTTIPGGCGASGATPTIGVRNVGGAQINSLQIQYWANNDTPSLYEWSGTIYDNYVEMITLPPLSVDVGQHTLNVRILRVNNQVDEDMNNNWGSAAFGLASTLALSASSTGESCVGACDGTAFVNTSGGFEPFEYTWGNTPGTSSAAGLCAGTYQVSVRDDIGCVQLIDVVVDQPPLTPVQLSTSTCFNGMSHWASRVEFESVAVATDYQLVFEDGTGASIEHEVPAPMNFAMLGGIEGLLTNHSYSVRARAGNGTCWGTWGDACNIQTPGEIEGPEMNGTADGIQLKRINEPVSWKTIPFAERYRIEVTDEAGNTRSEMLIGQSANNHFSLDNMPGLTTSAMYRVRVQARVGGRMGPFGSERKVYVAHNGGWMPGQDPAIEMDVFPNPSRGNMTVLLAGLEIDQPNVQVQVCDLTGRVLHQQQGASGTPVIALHVVPAAKLEPGVYFVRASQGNIHSQKKIVIQ